MKHVNVKRDILITLPNVRNVTTNVNYVKILLLSALNVMLLYKI